MKFNWGHGILIFIIIFVLLGISFIIFSLNQNQDLVANDYYDQGANYSNQIEINKRSYVYRDSISLVTGDSTVSINFAKGLAGRGDSLYVFFFRPSGKNSDYKVRIRMGEQASIPSSELAHGRYLVKLSWNHLNKVYNLEKELSIK